MKQFISISILILSIALTSCGHKHSQVQQMTREDSIKVLSDKAFQIQLSYLQKVREEFSGPESGGEPTIVRGEKLKIDVMSDSTVAVIGEFENLQAKLVHAQKDSSTLYGGLFTRFRLLNTQHKYLTATYTDEAHLLRYTSQITFDDKHEEDMDFYFSNGVLVYFRERRTFTLDEHDMMTEDSYFLRNNKVAYSYRDEGVANDLKDRMNVMSLKRYQLKGDGTAHVAKEFDRFKQDYTILLNQPLEPLIYPGEVKPQ